jgi:NADP-reducing hydrogenase subunit HndB
MKMTMEELDRIADRQRAATYLREGTGQAKITVHLGTCGIAAGARAILAAFLELAEAANAATTARTADETGWRAAWVLVTTSGCAGLCAREPMATVEVRGTTPVKYVDLTPEKAARIFSEHVQGGRPVAQLALVQGSERIS